MFHSLLSDSDKICCRRYLQKCI